MNTQDITITKKRGRPSTGLNPLIGVRLPPDLIEAIDVAIEAQPEPKPSRPEMIRRALGEWLQTKGYPK